MENKMSKIYKSLKLKMESALRKNDKQDQPVRMV